MTITMTLRTLMCAGALFSVCACSDDDGTSDSTSPATLDSGTPAADGGTPSTPAPDARYAVVTQVAVSGGGSSTSYVTLTNSLASSSPLSLEGAIQVSGRALAANETGAGNLFVATGGPELTKYTLDASSNKLVPAGKISFVEQGVSGIGEYASQLQFVSPTKAYYFDTRTPSIIVWNPTTLAITRTIDLSALRIPDTILTFSSTLPIKRGSKIVIGAGWRSSNNSIAIQQAALVVLDTAADTAAILRDERCAYVRDLAEGPDGRIYMATEAWGSSVHRLAPTFAPPPCLLRTDAAVTAFDSAFHRDLNALGGGVTGSLTQSRDGKVYTRVLDESAVRINADTSARSLASSVSAWRWAELTLGDEPTAKQLLDAPLGTGSMIVFDTKDQRFVIEIGPSSSDIIDLTRGLGPKSISTTGLTFSIAQVR